MLKALKAYLSVALRFPLLAFRLWKLRKMLMEIDRAGSDIPFSHIRKEKEPVVDQ